ncbi:MAG TPA: response regulator [Terriglobales bacterium]|nr:response regulator [Terriglobales bacterium]
MGQAYRALKRTILCIDDDSGVLGYERALLERSGYSVLTAESPEQGLALAMMSRLDAVVLDYHMPGMTGHEVAAAIKSCRPEVLIVMFSASEIPEETLRLTDAVVHKSDAITELLPTVAYLCNRSSSLPS